MRREPPGVRDPHPAGGAEVKRIFERTDPALASNQLIFPSKEYTARCSSVVSPRGAPAEQRQVEKAWAQTITG